MFKLLTTKVGWLEKGRECRKFSIPENAKKEMAFKSERSSGQGPYQPKDVTLIIHKPKQDYSKAFATYINNILNKLLPNLQRET